MTVDSTFEFERRRNRPIKYDRNLMMTTLKAMKRVEEIRAAREKRFNILRRRGVKARQKQEALREIRQGIDLIISPLVRQKQQLAQLEAVKAAETAEFKQATVSFGGVSAMPPASSGNNTGESSSSTSTSSTTTTAAAAKPARAGIRTTKRQAASSSMMD